MHAPALPQGVGGATEPRSSACTVSVHELKNGGLSLGDPGWLPFRGSTVRKNFIRSLRAAAVLAVTATLPACASAEETAAVPAQPSGPATDVKLSAVIADGAKQMRDQIFWIVARADGGAAEVVATQTGAAPKLALQPGRYLVTAKYGDTEVREEIAVGSEAAHHVLNLNAGIIRLRLVPNAGAPAVTGAVTWEVFAYSKAKPEDRHQITVAQAPQHEFVLPAGYYIVRARYDDTTSELVVPVEAGHTYKYTVNLYAGNVGLSALGANGKAVSEPVAWEIVRATPNADGVLETVTADVTPSRIFMLREGSYIVRAKTGDMIGESSFKVRAGTTSKVKVQLKPAALQAAADG